MWHGLTLHKRPCQPPRLVWRPCLSRFLCTIYHPFLVRCRLLSRGIFLFYVCRCRHLLRRRLLWRWQFSLRPPWHLSCRRLLLGRFWGQEWRSHWTSHQTFWRHTLRWQIFLQLILHAPTARHHRHCGHFSVPGLCRLKPLWLWCRFFLQRPAGYNQAGLSSELMWLTG